MLPTLYLSTSRWRLSRPSLCFDACVYVGWYFQCFLCACYPPDLVFTLCVLCHGLCLRVSITRCLRDGRYWCGVPSLQKRQTGSHGMRTRGLKLVRGWDVYISLPGCLHASDTSKSERVTVHNTSWITATEPLGCGFNYISCRTTNNHSLNANNYSFENKPNEKSR